MFVIIFEDKGCDKIHISTVFRCLVIILPLQTGGNILVPTMKL